MHTLRTGPVIGLFGQVVLFAVLAGTVGLGAAGWLAGIGFGLVTCSALSRALARSGAAALGPADRVTLARATLVGAVTALVVDAVTRSTTASVPLLVTLGSVALVLDAVDGKVARHTGTASALGARFDMEVDAFLILVLSGYAATSFGSWVLAIGGMRYGYVAAAWVVPWMRGSLPARYWRKVVAAMQGVVLVITAAGVLPAPLAGAALVAALGLLVESFGRDIGWLWRQPGAPGSGWVVVDHVAAGDLGQRTLVELRASA